MFSVELKKKANVISEFPAFSTTNVVSCGDIASTRNKPWRALLIAHQSKLPSQVKNDLAKSRANNVCLNNFVHRMRSPIFLFVQTLSAYWTSAFFWPLMTFYIQYFSYQFLGVLNCHEVSSSLNKFLWFGCGFCLYLYAFCGKRFLVWFIINMRFERYRTLKRVFKKKQKFFLLH